MAAPDSEVRISTRLDNSKLDNDFHGLSSKIKQKSTVFKEVNKAIQEIQKELDGASASLNDFLSGKKEPEALKKVSAEYKKASAELDKLIEKNIKLNDQHDKQAAVLAGIGRGKGSEAKREVAEVKLAETNFQLAETERLIEELRPKVNDLGASMEEIRLNPESSQEAQELNTHIDALSDALGTAKTEANKVKGEIASLAQEIADSQALSMDPTVQSIRAIAAEADKVNAAIERQRQEFQAASALYDQAEAALEAASQSGDKLAESLARANLDRAITDVEKADSNIKVLNYEALKLREMFEQIAVSPEGIDALAKMRAETSSLTFALDDAENSSKAISATINDAFDFDVQPPEDEINRVNALLQQVSDGASNAGEKIKSMLGALISFGTIGARTLSKMVSGLMGVNRNSRRASTGIGKLNNRLIRLAKNVFVFSLITRGLREIRQGIADLIKTNDQMSASLNAIQVNLLTAFAPIWEYIQPGLIVFLALLEYATAAIATFFAALGGQTYEQAKATAQALYEQIKALREAGKSAEEAGKKLAGFDRINKLAQDTAETVSGGLDFGSVTAPEFPGIEDFVNKLKDIANTILDVFRAAWNNVGDYVLAGWQHALTNILDLARKIGATFLEVWTDGHGQALLEALLTLLGTILFIIGDIAQAFSLAWDIAGYDLVASLFEMLTNILLLLNSIGLAFREAWNDGTGVSIATNLLQIFTNINLIISGLAVKLREAWEENDNGVRLWSAILGLVDDILSTINRMTSATVDWVNNLNLGPLLSGVVNLAEAFRGLASTVVDIFGWAYINVLLPFTKWLAELFVPAALNLLAAAFDAITAVLRALQPWAIWIWDNFLQPLVSWTGNVIITLINQLTGAFRSFSDWARANQSTIDLIVAAVLGFFAGLLIYSAATSIIAWINALGAALAAFGVKGLIAAVGANAPAVALGLLAAAIVAVASVWSGLSTGERVLAAIGVAALAAAAAIAIFHTSWTAGLAAGAIALGIAGIIATFMAVKNQLGSSISGLSSMGNFTSSLSSVEAGTPSMPSSASSLFAQTSRGSPLPKLAKGGIVDQATVAMIGERGKEAVVPLENNTEWMDTLADKLALRMNVNNSGGHPQSVNIIAEGDVGKIIRFFKFELDREDRRQGMQMSSKGLQTI